MKTKWQIFTFLFPFFNAQIEKMLKNLHMETHLEKEHVTAVLSQ